MYNQKLTDCEGDVLPNEMTVRTITVRSSVHPCLVEKRESVNCAFSFLHVSSMRSRHEFGMVRE